MVSLTRTVIPKDCAVCDLCNKQCSDENFIATCDSFWYEGWLYCDECIIKYPKVNSLKILNNLNHVIPQFSNSGSFTVVKHPYNIDVQMFFHANSQGLSDRLAVVGFFGGTKHLNPEECFGDKKNLNSEECFGDKKNLNSEECSQMTLFIHEGIDYIITRIPEIEGFDPFYDCEQ